jgi:hypothetical protein
MGKMDGIYRRGSLTNNLHIRLSRQGTDHPGPKQRVLVDHTYPYLTHQCSPSWQRHAVRHAPSLSAILTVITLPIYSEEV